MEKQNINSFLMASINDIQGTIRGIDNKIFAVLIILILPVSQLKEIVVLLENLMKVFPILGFFLSLAFILSWISAFFFSFRTIISIENPREHIKNASANGYFFGSGIFSIGFIQAIFTKCLVSNITVDEYLEKIKKTDIVQELVYEQIKLCYIRDLKIWRQKSGVIFNCIEPFLGSFYMGNSLTQHRIIIWKQL